MPADDRGTVLVFTRAPEGSTIEYTDRYQRAGRAHAARACPRSTRVFSVVALGIGTPGLVNEGALFASLAPREERERSQKEVVDELRADARARSPASWPSRPARRRSAASAARRRSS